MRLVPQSFTVSLGAVLAKEICVDERLVGKKAALISDNLILVKFFELAAGFCESFFHEQSPGF